MIMMLTFLYACTHEIGSSSNLYSVPSLESELDTEHTVNADVILRMGKKIITTVGNYTLGGRRP